jgi:hypothetical protein
MFSRTERSRRPKLAARRDNVLLFLGSVGLPGQDLPLTLLFARSFTGVSRGARGRTRKALSLVRLPSQSQICARGSPSCFLQSPSRIAFSAELRLGTCI